MNFHRAYGQIQTARYKLIRMTPADQSDDLLLTLSEHVVATLCFCGRFQARQRPPVTQSRCQYRGRGHLAAMQVGFAQRQASASAKL